MFFVNWIYKLSFKDVCLLILLLIFMTTTIWYLNMKSFTSTFSKKSTHKKSDKSEEELKEDDVSYLNIRYITECIVDYIEYLKEQNISLLNDKLINCFLELISENLDNSFNYIENDLLILIQKFNDCENINNSYIIKIIEKFMSSDFAKYHKELDWYFDLSPQAGQKGYIKDIMELLENNEEINDEKISKYLINRYSSIHTDKYFGIALNNIVKIISNPEKYKTIIEPLSINLNGKHISFSNFEQILSSTKLISSNEVINKFILKIIKEMKSCLDFDEEKYSSILSQIGVEYNKTEPLRNDLKDLIINCNIDEQKIIFGFNNDNNYFDNFNLLKEYEDVFAKKDDGIFETISNSYCNNEDYVVKSDLERHGFNLNDYKDKIFELIEKDLNNTIYLADMFTKEEIEKISFKDLEIEKLDFKNIENKEILSKISNQVKNILNECIKVIKTNKDDKDIVKEQINRFLIYA